MMVACMCLFFASSILTATDATRRAGVALNAPSSFSFFFPACI